jgi:hypothetical protein
MLNVVTGTLLRSKRDDAWRHASLLPLRSYPEFRAPLQVKMFDLEILAVGDRYLSSNIQGGRKFTLLGHDGCPLQQAGSLRPDFAHAMPQTAPPLRAHLP